MSADETTPRATIVRRTPNPDFPGAELVWVACPLCSETHQHGLPDGRDTTFPTHRVAHCSVGSGGGYLIVDHGELSR